MNPNILYCDTDILVCEKPAGMLSEGENDHSMPAALSDYLYSRQRPSEVFPVHRLDRETEGLMVYALNRASASALSQAIAEGQLEKEYLAVVCGRPEADRATLTDLLFYDRRRNKSFVVTRQRKGVKEAVLDYTLLQSEGGYSLLRIRLRTGRTHQIRVQFASRKMPLQGDRRYGAPADGRPFALYSHRLRFRHPITGENMDFCSYPEWYKQSK